MKRSRRVLLLAALAALLGTRGAAAGEAPIVRVPFRDPILDETSFFGLYHERQKVGWGLLSLVRETPEGAAPRYVSRSVFQADVRGPEVLGQLDFESVDVFDGTWPYDLLRAWERRTDGQGTTTVRVSREDGAYRLTTETEAELGTQRIEIDYTLVDRLTQVEWLRQRPAVGAAITVRELDISSARPRRFTYAVRGREWWRAGALSIEATRVALGSEERPHSGEAWIGARGRPLEAPLADRLVMRLESREQARDLSLASEVAAFGRVPLVGDLGVGPAPRRVTLAAYGRGAADLPAGPRVRVTWSEERLEALVDVAVADLDGVAATEEEVAEARRGAHVDEALEAPLAALAARAVGDAMGPASRTDRLLGFVAGWVEDAFVPGEPSLAVILDDPAGDATEHVRAFVALAARAGIVARPVVGLIHVGGARPAFEGHAWCEVLRDGRWIEVDPALGLARVGADHLPFARGSLDLFDVLQRSRHLQFELRAVER